MADATWVSLFTVRAILPQVKLSRQDHDFHNVSTASDLGCGKRGSPAAFRGEATAVGWGNRTAVR